MALKTYKPITPGRRQMTVASFAELTKKKPEKALLNKIKGKSGRNNTGKITVRHRGGLQKRHYRAVDFKRTDKLGIEGTIKAIEYDPNRNAYICLVNYADGDKRYHLAPQHVSVGHKIVTKEKGKIKAGNRLMIKNIPVGLSIYNIELAVGKGGQIVRTAGSSAKLVSLEGRHGQVQLPSGEVRYVNKSCYATIGVVSNPEYSNIKIGKAGRKRKMGKRPQVRGKAMNPCDHPHGGGEGGCPIGLKNPKTPKGRPALGLKTRKRKYTDKWIIKRRSKKKRR